MCIINRQTSEYSWIDTVIHYTRSINDQSFVNITWIDLRRHSPSKYLTFVKCTLFSAAVRTHKCHTRPERRKLIILSFRFHLPPKAFFIHASLSTASVVRTRGIKIIFLGYVSVYVYLIRKCTARLYIIYQTVKI